MYSTLSQLGNNSYPISFPDGKHSHPSCATAGTRFAKALAAEKLDEYGASCQRFIRPRDAKVPAKRKRPTTNESHGNVINTDTEDQTFVAIPVSDGKGDDDSVDSESDDIEIGNEEVCLI